MFTTDEIMALRPCGAWPREKVQQIVGEGITGEQIAGDERIPIADRRWVLTRLCAEMDRRALVLWACGCAQDVRHLLIGDAQDTAYAAIATAIEWTEGTRTVEDCRDAAAAAAASAASAAAYAASAASAAAYAASAASAAANAASAAYAAYAAAAAAYAAAANDAANAALALEHVRQLGRIVDFVRGT